MARGTHYAVRDTFGPPSVLLLEQLHRQGLKLVTMLPLDGGRVRTYLEKKAPEAPAILLKKVPDQQGAGREWFHAEYVGVANGCPAPTFTVTPDIYLEPWSRDPFYGWIAGENGTYTVTARSTAAGCEAEGILRITIAHD